MVKTNSTNKLTNNKLKQTWCKFQDWRARIQQRQREGKTLPNDDLAALPESKCMNCGHSFRGHNCPNCGQAADTKRITLRAALRNMFVTIFGGDSAFLCTCGNLLYRPGFMIRDFLCGKRARYYRPVQMLLCLVTIYALLAFVFKDSLSLWNDLQLSATAPPSEDATFAPAMETLQKLLSNEVAFSLFFAFITVLPFKLLFRRKTVVWPDGEARWMNTAEHFFTLIYLSCQNLLLRFLLLPLHCIPGAESAMNRLEFFLMVFLSTWVYRQIFGIKWLNSLWRNIVAMTIVLLLILVLFILYFGVYYGIAAVVR